MTSPSKEPVVPAGPRVFGRYALFGEIASGGMATVHFCRLVGSAGFSRLVAVKKLHPQFAKDPDFVAMFLDEARLASRIQHPNVVSTLDVVTVDDELILVMEYVAGESLARLLRNTNIAKEARPPGHVVSVMSGVLHGLHAAHEAKSERREPLQIVHRDISPQNVLVGSDGVARVLDFGVAKAAMRSQSTRDGLAKGKLSYMAPEQLGGHEVDRRTDIFSAGVVLWEALCGKRLFHGNDPGGVFGRVMSMEIPRPSSVVSVPEELSWVVMRALERDPEKRFQTAREFAIELEAAADPSSAHEVGMWVERLGGEALRLREAKVAEVESVSTDIGDLRALRESSRPPEATPSSRSALHPVQRPSHSGAFARAGAYQPEAAEPPVSQSQISMVGVGAPAAPPPRAPTSTRVVLLALVACAVGGAAAFLLSTRARPFDDGEPRAPSAAGAPVGTAAPRQPKKGVAVEDLPALVPEDEADPGVTITDESFLELEPAAPEQGAPTVRAPTPRRAARTAPARKAPPAVSASAAAPKSVVNCDPPWLVDSSGIRRPKPECL
jgi:serine/threonine-protein kinase